MMTEAHEAQTTEDRPPIPREKRNLPIQERPRVPNLCWSSASIFIEVAEEHRKLEYVRYLKAIWKVVCNSNCKQWLDARKAAKIRQSGAMPLALVHSSFGTRRNYFWRYFNRESEVFRLWAETQAERVWQFSRMLDTLQSMLQHQRSQDILESEEADKQAVFQGRIEFQKLLAHFDLDDIFN